MIRAAIVGAAGYTGGELLRLLSLHPAVSSFVAVSESHAGQSFDTAHSDLFLLRDQTFVASFAPQDVDVTFLCGGHGDSSKLLKKHSLDPARDRIIDLSQDFRPRGAHPAFTYGLPEAFEPEIRESHCIANPGCFATAIQLALLPLAKAQKLKGPVHITGITGSTGAGQKLQDTSHFSWRHQNMSSYKVFQHQHLKEILESLRLFQADASDELLFVPMRGAFTRGILCSFQLRLDDALEDLVALYEDTYARAPFVHIMPPDLNLKQVINTNHALISLEKQGSYVHLVTCLDNLLKGASGQAIQNMNLMFQRPETEGLALKSPVF